MKYMLIDKTIYAGERLTQFTSDTMLGSVKEDRRTGKAEVSSEVHQKATSVQTPRDSVSILGTLLRGHF